MSVSLDEELVLKHIEAKDIPFLQQYLKQLDVDDLTRFLVLLVLHGNKDMIRVVFGKDKYRMLMANPCAALSILSSVLTTVEGTVEQSVRYLLDMVVHDKLEAGLSSILLFKDIKAIVQGGGQVETKVVNYYREYIRRIYDGYMADILA